MMGIEENDLLRKRVERRHLLRRHRIPPQAVHYDDQHVVRGAGDGRKFLCPALSASNEKRDEKTKAEFHVLHGGIIQAVTKLSGAKFHRCVSDLHPHKRAPWRLWTWRACLAVPRAGRVAPEASLSC